MPQLRDPPDEMAFIAPKKFWWHLTGQVALCLDQAWKRLETSRPAKAFFYAKDYKHSTTKHVDCRIVVVDCTDILSRCRITQMLPLKIAIANGNALL